MSLIPRCLHPVGISLANPSRAINTRSGLCSVSFSHSIMLFLADLMNRPNDLSFRLFST
jgi:hypothetical protein